MCAFATSYYDNALQDFNFLPGVVLEHALLNHSDLGNRQHERPRLHLRDLSSRYGFEPSVNANYQALPWLTLLRRV